MSTRIEIDIEKELSPAKVLTYQEILIALIGSGALDLKNGGATLHFDSEGQFQGCEVKYWAFKRRKGN